MPKLKFTAIVRSEEVPDDEDWDKTQTWYYAEVVGWEKCAMRGGATPEAAIEQAKAGVRLAAEDGRAFQPEVTIIPFEVDV